MNYSLTVIFKFSIIIALVIGLIRYGKISRTYHPFIFIIIAAFLGEIIGTATTWLFKSNALSSNIYTLAECFLWLWQFKRWNGGFKKQWMESTMIAGLICFWIVESFLNHMEDFNSSFVVLYSFILVFLAINQVNQLIVQEKTNLLKNAKFLICAGVIIFYTYSVLVNSFYVLQIKKSDSFLSNIYYILIYVNLFVNLLYAYATLWIPSRERFTLPS